MADDGTSAVAQKVELDAEGKRLQLDAAKASYAADIVSEKRTVEAKAASLRTRPKSELPGWAPGRE